MADGENAERDKEQPSLELPTLGWRRKRRPPRDTAPPTAPEPPPVAQPEPERPLFADQVPRPAAAASVDVRPSAPAPVTHALPQVRPPERADVGSEEARAPRGARIPRPGGMPAAVLTGVVVGLGIVGLTWASLQLCESVRGTSSCGGTGYGLLAAILVVMVIVGALLLRAARVSDPGSTSVLAVGLTSVIALLFLVDSLLDRAMIVVIPVICAGAFAAAHWVTHTFIEPAER